MIGLKPAPMVDFHLAIKIKSGAFEQRVPEIDLTIELHAGQDAIRLSQRNCQHREIPDNCPVIVNIQSGRFPTRGDQLEDRSRINLREAAVRRKPQGLQQ